jgi:hypothetical protein
VRSINQTETDAGVAGQFDKDVLHDLGREIGAPDNPQRECVGATTAMNAGRW